jgi:hypothetical protein
MVWPVNDDRRKRERVALQCPVHIMSPTDGQTGTGMTVNISSQGVYWISQFPFAPGEQVQCSIFISSNGFRPEPAPLSLECRVRVVRVEETVRGFGVGCLIEHYSVASSRHEDIYSNREQGPWNENMRVP